MPTINPTPTIIGMTITTSPSTQSSTSALYDSNHRKMNQRRLLYLMEHPPPPPPISSVFVRSQHTMTDRRSMTSHGNTEDIYKDNDDDSVSSCSMEVMSVNATYAYHNHCIVEASSIQPRLCSSYTNSTMAGYSCGDSEDDEEEEETSTADSTGSFDHKACPMYCNDPETGRKYSSRRRSQRKSQPQQMARILACSSPEITALCKSSFRLPNETSRPRLQQQVSSDMMSIGSSDTNDSALERPSPDVRMESTSTTKTLFLPPRCPPTTMLYQEQTTQESSPSPVRADQHIPNQSSPPLWTDVWLRDVRDTMAEVSAEMIPSSSSDTDDPHASFRSSSYPMHHFSDGPTSTSRPLRYHSNSPPPPIVTRKSHTTTSTSPPIDHDLSVAIVLDPLSKLSLHRRVSYDQLPSWKEIDFTATTNRKDVTLNDASNRNSKLEKLVLHKTVTVVSDEMMR